MGWAIFTTGDKNGLGQSYPGVRMRGGQFWAATPGLTITTHLGSNLSLCVYRTIHSSIVSESVEPHLMSEGLKPDILFHLQLYQRLRCCRKAFYSSSPASTTRPGCCLSCFIPWPVTRKCKRRHNRKWMRSLVERSVLKFKKWINRK